MNANKLKGKIVEQGLSIAKVADLIGMHRSSLYRKINGHEKMTVAEAIKLKNILGLTDLEALDIFLSRGDDSGAAL